MNQTEPGMEDVTVVDALDESDLRDPEYQQQVMTLMDRLMASTLTGDLERLVVFSLQSFVEWLKEQRGNGAPIATLELDDLLRAFLVDVERAADKDTGASDPQQVPQP